MGLRFRRTVKLLPGVRLNISRSGITTSIGPRGARVTLGGTRTRVTTGLPGTGLSYTTLLPQDSQASSSRSRISSPSGTAWLALLCVIALVAFCSSMRAERSVPVPPAPARLASQPLAAERSEPERSTLKYVAADVLNVRDSAKGAIVGSMTRGTRVDVYEARGGWSRVSKRDAPPRWVSSSNLCEGPGCYKPEKPASGKAEVASAAAAATLAAAALPSRRAASSNSSPCPCSSSSNCYGPRGGRYCITSGGGKRYR